MFRHLKVIFEFSFFIFILNPYLREFLNYITKLLFVLDNIWLCCAFVILNAYKSFY